MQKKYRSFENDYKQLLKDLESNPYMGIDLGNGYRKERIAITSKGKGKSGGARVITLNMLERNDSLYLLYVYDKSEYDNIVISVLKDTVAYLGLGD